MVKVHLLNFADALHLGFGVIDTSALIESGFFPQSITGLALIANLPQILLSALYFSYNSLFTAMLMGQEWTSYAHKRKGLRVSRKPVGSQRSTHFLQLPYRFGIPFVVLSGTLHWLVSQSIFLVAIDLTKDPPSEISRERTCGYSPLAMLAVIVLGVAMIIAVYGFGFLSYKTGIPLVGSCSVAIGSACHPKRTEGAGDTPVSEQKLQFGVVEMRDDGVGRCSFSSEEVWPLVKGGFYM
jgi:hypothetical protein